MKKLNSQETIDYMLHDLGYKTYYAIAKKFREYDLPMQAGQLSNYHRGKNKISHASARWFKKYFDIEITDVYKPQGRPSYYDTI